MTESNLAKTNEVKFELSARSFFEISENEPKAKFELSEKNFLVKEKPF